jgi:hypothetical protein
MDLHLKYNIFNSTINSSLGIVPFCAGYMVWSSRDLRKACTSAQVEFLGLALGTDVESWITEASIYTAFESCLYL